MAPHFNGYAGTLIFPLAFVTLEVLYAAFSPFGSWGAAAYSQYGYLPLMQLVSVTGMPGIAFLVAWFAAVANWAWEHRREPDLRTAGLATYGGVVLAVLLCGYLRLNAAPPALVIGTDGQILFEHVKYGGNFIEGSVRGDGSLQVANTPFGLLSATIWYDADFPDAIRQVGEAGAGLFVLPSNDWDTITPIHGYMAVYRAIENGMSIVRETDYGLSLAADPYGRMLAQLDNITTDDRTLVAEVPTQHVNTIYLMGGYLFGWLVVAAFCLMATVALRRSSIARSATRASSGEPGYSA
jgi:apolipoprotein N-acyltransferase